MIGILPPCKKCWLYLRDNRGHPACRECKARVLYAKAVRHDIPYQQKAMPEILAAISTKTEIKAAYKKQMEIPSMIQPEGFESKIAPKQKTPDKPVTMCRWPGCYRLGDNALGYCKRCYLRYIRSRPIGVGGVKECKTRGCKEPGNYACGLCSGCYSRKRYKKGKAA